MEVKSSFEEDKQFSFGHTRLDKSLQIPNPMSREIAEEKIRTASKILGLIKSLYRQLQDIEDKSYDKMRSTYALFDQHLITFDNSGKIILASNLKDTEYKKIGVSGKEHIKNFKPDHMVYLEKHQAVFSSKYNSN